MRWLSWHVLTKVAIALKLLFGHIQKYSVLLTINLTLYVYRNFGESCSAVQDAMVSQIKKWNGPDGCKNGGEKCLYAVCIRCTCCRDDISLLEFAGYQTIMCDVV